jgi:hypothetical protein
MQELPYEKVTLTHSHASAECDNDADNTVLQLLQDETADLTARPHSHADGAGLGSTCENPGHPVMQEI